VKPEPKSINQYDLILAMAEYIRQHPDALLSKQIKQCKSQSDQIKLFQDFDLS
jgi:hypothetical protein